MEYCKGCGYAHEKGMHAKLGMGEMKKTGNAMADTLGKGFGVHGGTGKGKGKRIVDVY